MEKLGSGLKKVTIYMKENNLKGYYILTGMAKV